MLIFDKREIGNRLLAIRKKSGLTQIELAELASLADRTYADIERGSVNMRVDTLLNICSALHITPDEVLTKNDEHALPDQDELLARLNSVPPLNRETALELVDIYLKSVTLE